jgi:hypothetical protein
VLEATRQNRQRRRRTRPLRSAGGWIGSLATLSGCSSTGTAHGYARRRPVERSRGAGLSDEDAHEKEYRKL